MNNGPKSALRIRLGIIFTVIVLLALGSWWVNMVVRKSASTGGVQEERSDPDYIVENFRYFKMKPDGRPQYEAIGSKMFHYPVEDSYLIEKPIIYSVNEFSQLQTIQSNEAYIEDFNTKVHMRGDVVFDREAAGSRNPFRLNSEYVLIYPDDEIMTSDKEVTVRDNNSVMSGVGMRANNATRELQISSRARITYNSNQR